MNMQLDNSISAVTDNGWDDVFDPWQGQGCLFCHHVQTGFGAHPAYLEGSFPSGKAATP
jgi:hypothetical protein